MENNGFWIGIMFPSSLAVSFVFVVIAGRIKMWWMKRAWNQRNQDAFDARQETINELIIKYRAMVAALPYIAERIDARIRQLTSWIAQEAPLTRSYEIHLLYPVQDDLIALLTHATTAIRGETPVEFRSRMMAYLNGNEPAKSTISYPTQPEPEPEPEPESESPSVYDQSVPRPPEPHKADDKNMITVGDLGTRVDSSLAKAWEKKEQSKSRSEETE